jgi:hypothetical protein
MAGPLVRTVIAVSSDSEANEFVAGPDRATFERSIMLAAGNGTNNFGKIKAGTALQQITSSKLYRPAFKATANGAGVTATTLNLNEAITGNLLVLDTLYFATQADTNTVASITDTDTVELSSTHSWDDNETIYINGTEDSGAAKGFLRTTVSTVESVDSDGTVTHTNRSARMVYRGAVVESRLINWASALTAPLKVDLQGHITFLGD